MRKITQKMADAFINNEDVHDKPMLVLRRLLSSHLGWMIMQGRD